MEHIGAIIEWIITIGAICTAILSIRKIAKGIQEKTDKNLQTRLGALESSITKMINEQKESVEKRFDKIENTVDQNERDRLCQLISEAANACRRGVKMTADEYEYLKNEVVPKYHNLHGNHTGDMEWQYIYEYYIKQCEKQANETASNNN